MKSKLIVALDVDSYDRATALVTDLRGAADIFKVGSQLFTRVGPKIVEFINAQGRQCFLDLKFHDIPTTVAKAVESAAALRVFMLTVHASGGAEMLKAAVTDVADRPHVFGVTVLTSTGGDVREDVLRLAALSKECGLDGVISSPREVRPIRDKLGKDFLIATPGVRPAGAKSDDQKRVMTAAEAARAGANYVIVGRPIVAVKDPVAAAMQLKTELESAALA